ncbi:hypothetical protein RQP46_008526 [Phenoliferia psychrophenolica]
MNSDASYNMLDILKRAGGVFEANPPVADIDISQAGSDFLWAVFACMMAGALGLLFFGAMRPVGQRAFFHLGAVLCFTASIAYYCMASDLGAAAIRVEYIRAGQLGGDAVARGIAHPTRSVWYARYIDWVVTTPLLLLELLLTTGLPLSEVFVTIFFDEAMIITGLLGALVSSQYKWGLFTFGMFAEVYITYVLFGPGLKSAAGLGPDFHRAYFRSTVILSFLWVLYPVCWALADGGNVISPNAEMIFYGVLDVLAKPVFCFYHCYEMSKCDYSKLGFTSGKVSDGATDRQPLTGSA